MFGILGTVWNTVIYYPILNALVFLYIIIPGNDFGVSIVLTTVIIQVILLPLSKKQLVAQKKMQELQPEIKKIQDRYKDNKQEQSKALMEFYQKHKVNPLSSCLPLVVRFILIIALYSALRHGLGGNLDGIYDVVGLEGEINTMAFGFLDLSTPSIPLAIIAGALQFIQGKMLQPKKPTKKRIEKDVKKDDEVGLGQSFQSAMNTQMVYFFPLITVFIGATFPSGIALYWVASTLFQVVQQKIIFKNPTATSDTEDKTSKKADVGTVITAPPSSTTTTVPEPKKKNETREQRKKQREKEQASQ